MIVFTNEELFTMEDMNRSERTISTLLIPELLVEGFLKKRLEEHGNNTAVYLRNLLWMYKVLTHSGMIPKPRKIKTEYQEENLNLKRVSFRPANSDWIELGALSLVFGKSRCWLFTYLLKLDLMDFWHTLTGLFESLSVPTTPNLELQSSWTLDRFFHSFARGYHVKV